MPACSFQAPLTSLSSSTSPSTPVVRCETAASLGRLLRLSVCHSNPRARAELVYQTVHRAGRQGIVTNPQNIGRALVGSTSFRTEPDIKKRIYFSVIANEPSQSEATDICRSELMRDAKRA